METLARRSECEEGRRGNVDVHLWYSILEIVQKYADLHTHARRNWMRYQRTKCKNNVSYEHELHFAINKHINYKRNQT